MDDRGQEHLRHFLSSNCIYWHNLCFCSSPPGSVSSHTDTYWRGFPIFAKFSSFTTPSPRWISIPKTFPPLYLLFHPTSFLRHWFSFLFQRSINISHKLVSGRCSMFSPSFDEFVWEKADCASYSSNIMRPHHDPGRSILLIEILWLFSKKQCLTLCDPLDCSTQGVSVPQHLPGSDWDHVHWMGEAMQLSPPISSMSPPDLIVS